MGRHNQRAPARVVVIRAAPREIRTEDPSARCANDAKPSNFPPGGKDRHADDVGGARFRRLCRGAGREARDERAGARGAGQAAASTTPLPRRLPEIAYAIEPRMMIERTLIARSTRVIARASFGATA